MFLFICLSLSEQGLYGRKNQKAGINTKTSLLKEISKILKKIHGGTYLQTVIDR